MREQRINEETARLANSIGFGTEDCICGGFPDCICGDDVRITQSLLQKILRDSHGVHVQVLFQNMELQYYFLEISKDDGTCLYDWQKDFNAILEKSHQDIEGDYIDDNLFAKYVFEDGFGYYIYEEALEAGLQKAIRTIKEK